eukprot:13210299-Alexandrium_andersonii.AAC.1
MQATHVARLIGNDVRRAAAARQRRQFPPCRCTCCGDSAASALATPLSAVSDGVAWRAACLPMRDACAHG